MSTFGKLTDEVLNGASEEDIDKRIDEALTCPCVADLRDGPCGESFKGAFRCYVKSTHEEKGMDCIEHFTLFQGCLSKHPEHVEAILDDAEEKEQQAEKKEAEAHKAEGEPAPKAKAEAPKAEATA